MSQGNTVLPTVGTVTGLTMTQDANAAMQALLTQNSGASAPTNGPSAAPILGQTWIDTSVTPNILKMYDNTSWIVFGYVDITNHLWLPVIGGGTDTIASGATTDLGSKGSTYLTVSGVAAITSLGSTAPKGTMKVCRATGAFTLTHNATSLILPNNGSNIVAVSGDTFIAVHLGSGNWVVPTYQRADGTAISSSAVFTGAVFFNGGIIAAASTDQDNYAPAGLATANRIFISSTANINITGIQSPASNGQMLVIHNTTGIGAQTLLPQSTLSSSSNRFIIPYPIVIRPGNSVVLDYDSTGGGWRAQTPVASPPIAGLTRSLSIDPNTGSPTTKVDVSVAAVTLESTLGEAYRATNVSITIASTVNGANGLDTGTLSPSTLPQFLAEYVIYGSSLNTVAGLFSLSTSAPVMPSGYTYRALVGFAPVELSTATNRLLAVRKRGQKNTYIVGSTSSVMTRQPTIIEGTAGTFDNSLPVWATSDVSGVVVPLSASEISINIMNARGGGAAVSIAVAPSTLYFGPSNAVSGRVKYSDAAAGVITIADSIDMILESSRIAYVISGAGGGLYCGGWTDNI